MKVFYGQDALRDAGIANSALTLGVFDGVHIGHQRIIESVIEAKRKAELDSAVLFTFKQHPLSVTHPGMAPPILTTLEEKLSLLEKYNLDAVFIVDFTKELAARDYREFISEVLIGGLGMRHFVVGYDFHLGHNREGSQEKLASLGDELGFEVTVVPPVVTWGTVVSSTKIRRCISEAKLKSAGRFLGRSYFFDAVVVKGAGVGKKLEFPTANLVVESQSKLLPPDGVYAVEVEIGGKVFAGMMNIGFAPTIHSDGSRRIEVHIFELSSDIYGERVRVYIKDHVRDEEKFENDISLKEQLKKDKWKVMEILKKND